MELLNHDEISLSTFIFLHFLWFYKMFIDGAATFAFVPVNWGKGLFACKEAQRAK